MRITYEYILKLFPNLTDAEKEEFRLLFERKAQEEKNPVPKKGFNFDWEGRLSDLRHKYTSVELQHEISRRWANI